MGLTEKEKNINLIKILTLISRSDDRNQPFEDRFLHEVAKKCGIEGEELSYIISTAAKEDIDFPEDEKDRMIQFYHALIMMKIDTVIDSKEIKIIKELGEYFQFNEMMVNDLINLMDKYKKGVIPNKELVEIISRDRDM